MVFEEGFFQFEFDDHWQVVKFDMHPGYRNGIEKLDGTKAVDFAGVLDNDVYFIEVKDFRHYRIENEQRLIKGDLPIELGQKVKDSVACVIGANRTASDLTVWEPFVQILSDRSKVIKIALWLEYDSPSYPAKRSKVQASVQSNQFKSKLKWLTSQVLVVNLANNSLPHLTVRNLPRSN